MMRSKSRLNSSSRTFKRSHSNELPPSSLPPSPSSVPEISPPLEFPASPQLTVGEEIWHFSHLHPLSKIDLLDQFTCAGCKEYGAGKRFSCQQCDYQLHDFCGSAPQTLKGHPLHHQHRLAFHSVQVKGGILKSKCSICAKPVKGYHFQCVACSFQMHPSCSMLQEEIMVSSHSHTLKLLAQSAGEPAGYVCGECRRKRSGRVYRCTVCDYHLHAACAKGNVSGLHENGFKGRLEKLSTLGAAVNLASKVVIDFIGGIIEGLGQAVGEVLVQNIARGRGYSRSTTAED